MAIEDSLRTTIMDVKDHRHRILDTPTGRFYVNTDAQGGIRTGWMAMLERAGSTPGSLEELGPEDQDLRPDLCLRILEAMNGISVDFADVDIAPGTPFQRAIWRATREIVPGSVLSYGRLAAKVGRPGAARAVGQAMRRNPQPIITPCHRVVSTAGIGGFGGENEDGTSPAIKIKLLRAEGMSRV